MVNYSIQAVNWCKVQEVWKKLGAGLYFQTLASREWSDGLQGDSNKIKMKPGMNNHATVNSWHFRGKLPKNLEIL